MRLFLGTAIAICLLWCTASATPTEVQKCEACHAFVDSFYLQLQDTFESRKSRKPNNKVMQIPSDEVLAGVCDGMRKETLYGPSVIQMCEAFWTSYRDQLLETFKQQFTVADNVEHFWLLKKGICNGVSPGCIPDSAPVTPCTACEGIMRDVQRVASWGTGRDNFGSTQHLYHVLDDICLTLSVRHPLAGRDSILETCADLLDEHSKAIVTTLRNAITVDRHTNPQWRVCTEIAQLCPKNREL